MIRNVSAMLALIWICGAVAYARGEGFLERRPAEILLEDPSGRSFLILMDLVIDGMDDGAARVFLTPDEFNRVRSLGMEVRWIVSGDVSGRRSKSTIDGYPSHDEATSRLRDHSDARPDICLLESAGQSLQGRELWWLKLSDRVREEEAEPEICFIAAIHGDEALTTVLLLRLIDHLIDGYGRDGRITRLIDETEIWIMPVMNPDGLEAGSRFNAAGVDLNRDFPDPVHETAATMDGRQPETRAIMEWVQENTPVLVSSFHTGSLVVNYPWDSDWDGDGAVEYEIAPDDDLFRFISGVYASSNLSILAGPFGGGISNGSAWYPIRGGMQDFLYSYHGCLAVTIELSRIKRPASSSFDSYWEENREAMLSFLELSRMGVHGVVTDSETGEPLAAGIRLEGVEGGMFTDPDAGDYHRMLLPGEYGIHFTADGYASEVRAVVIGEDEQAVLDVALEPLPSAAEESEKNGSGGCFVGAAAVP